MSHGGKGDKPRPLSVPIEDFDNRWETIFGKKETVVDELEEYKLQAQELWNDSCTAPRKK